MRVFRGLSRRLVRPTALTIGNFDGVHLGHRALLARLTEVAGADALDPTVLTFEPHPREYFAPASAPARLSTLREKLELIADEGIAQTVVARFNAQLAALSAEAFVERILVDTLRVRHLIIGDDFCFGAGRRGNFALLQAAGQTHGFTVEAMGSVRQDEARVSSSAVRQALADGQMTRAARLLGRPYAIDGRVVHGQAFGRQLGFATANIRIKHRNPPVAGVFAVEVRGLADGPHVGVANIGVRPSVNAVPHPILEVHLFDFSADIYGRHLNVRFIHKLRDERRFDDFNDLKAQIARDVASARQFFLHQN